MQDNGSVPVIAGLAVGVGFVILISSWSAFAPMHAGDYIRIGNSNALVKSFLNTFPNAHVTAEEYHINATGAKGAILYYATPEPWADNSPYDIPVYMRVLIDGQGRPYFFLIHCQSENGVQERRVWLQEHVGIFLETSERCQEAIRLTGQSNETPPTSPHTGISINIKLKEEFGDWEGQQKAVDVLLLDSNIQAFVEGKTFEVWAYGADFPQASLKGGVCDKGECTLIGIRERNSDGSVDCALKTFVNVENGRLDDVQYSTPCDYKEPQSRSSGAGEYTVTINGQTYDIDYEISGGHVDRIEVDASVASFEVFLSDVNEDGTLKVHFSKEIIRQLELAERENLAFDDFLVFVDEISVDASWENSAGDMLGTIPSRKGSENVEIIGSFLL